MEGPPGPSEEVDAWQKRRAAQRARRRWNNARPIHSHVPLRNMEHRTGTAASKPQIRPVHLVLASHRLCTSRATSCSTDRWQHNGCIGPG